MFDWQSYNMGYGAGHDDGQSQAEADRSSTSLMIMLFSLAFKLIHLIILLTPALFCAYLIMSGLKPYMGELTEFQYLGVLLIVAYLIECILFFLKGWFIALKQKGNGLWITLWLVCVIYILVLPALMFHFLFLSMFVPPSPSPSHNLVIISWVMGILTGLYICAKHRLRSDVAPRYMFWSYRLGRRL